MDIFLSICFIGGLLIWVCSKYYPSSKDNYIDEAPLQTDIDKLIEREKDKDILHNQQLDNLNCEINLLKNSSTELNIKNQNLIIEHNKLQKQYIEQIKNLSDQLSDITEEKRKVTSQKKSSEVRLGHIAETLAPFLDQFDFDPETCVFLGKPIDYISFGDDEITFIEVKSGKSQLNQKQRYIRDQIKSNLVTWKEVRIK